MLRNFVALLVVAILAMGIPFTAAANVADSSQVTTKRVVVRFVEKGEVRAMCGARARACAFTNANVVILPEDEAYGWTGTRMAHTGPMARQGRYSARGLR